MTKKRSLLLVMSVAFMALYITFSIGEYLHSSLQYYDTYVGKKTVHMLNYLKLADTLLKVGEVKDLQDRLYEAKESYYIDFYFLKNGNEIVFSENVNNESGKLSQLPERLNEILYFENYVLSSIKVGDQVMTIGFNKTRMQYLEYIIREEYDLILRDIIIVILGFIGITTFFFKDILATVRVLRGSKDRSFAKIKGSSYESDLLLRGIRGFQEKQGLLAAENAQLRNQVLPSLRSELDSRKTPPYQFQCTLVRTDINNFSTIFSSYPVEEVMTFVNQFFLKASDLIGRYGGFVHETIGDEIIYYFKDANLFDSVPIALACVRDLNELAEDLNKKNKIGFEFSIKSGIANGNLRYGTLLNGFGLAGGVLIESVRILSAVDERHKNIVYFGKSVAVNAKAVCETVLEKKVALKGLSGEFELYTVSKFRSLEVGEASDSSRLKYFRSDAAILEIFRFIRSQIGSLTSDGLIEMASRFRDFHIEKTSPEIREAFLAVLRELLALSKEKAEFRRAISAFLTAGMYVLDKNCFGPDVDQAVRGALAIPDPRIVANGIELLGHFGEIVGEVIGEMADGAQRSNRSMANSLIVEGKKGLTSKVVRDLEAMLNNSDLMFVASGLYALRVLYGHYIVEDIVYLRSQVEFCGLLKYANRHLDSENSFVKNQAALALTVAAQVVRPAA